jgi:hypothetical protein
MISKRGAILPLLLLAACNRAPDNGELAEAEARGSREAAEDGRIECALEGTKLFDRTCTVEEMSSEGGAILVVGRSNVGYRRLQIATDGRGVVSADGAEPAKVSIVGDNVIEVAIGNDRYRLPANTGGAK